MKIGIVGANGRIGQMLVNEALNKQLDTVAIVRNKNRTKTQQAIIKDLFDLVEDDVKDFDVLVNCFGTKDESKFDDFKRSIEHLSNLISNTNTRLIVVGGAGSLYIDESKTKQLYQTEDFPNFVRPTAEAAAHALAYLRTRNDVIWTYISPAVIFDFKGEKNGHTKVAGEILQFNKDGKSYISYKDYAVELVNESKEGNNIRKRISYYQD